MPPATGFPGAGSTSPAALGGSACGLGWDLGITEVGILTPYPQGQFQELRHQSSLLRPGVGVFQASSHFIQPHFT